MSKDWTETRHVMVYGLEMRSDWITKNDKLDSLVNYSIEVTIYTMVENSFTESILKKSQNFDFFPIMYNLLQKKIRRTIYLTYTRNHRLKYY